MPGASLLAAGELLQPVEAELDASPLAFLATLE